MATINWTSLGTAGGGMSVNTSVGKNASGRLEVFVTGTDNALWHIWQVPTNGPWSKWASLGLPSSTPVAGVLAAYAPTVTENDDGRLEVFVTGSDNALWHIWQLAPNGAWSTTWASLGHPSNVGIANPYVHVNDDGRLEVFAIGFDNALWHIWQLVPNGAWSGWASLGKPANMNLINQPVASQNADGRLEAFVLSSEGALWHIWQDKAGGAWGNWASLGNPPIGNANSVYSPLVRKNDDGRLEVFLTVQSDSTLWHIWQVVPNGAWSAWASLGKPPTANANSSPSVRKNKDGHLEAFVIGSDGALWHIWQVVIGGAWGHWASLGTPPHVAVLLPTPFVAENKDGRLEAFAVGSDNALWHTWQVSPGGNWE